MHIVINEKYKEIWLHDLYRDFNAEYCLHDIRSFSYLADFRHELFLLDAQGP